MKRVQNYVEALDVLKVKNSMANGQQKQSSRQRLATIQEHRQEQKPIQSLMDMPINYKQKKQEIEEEPGAGPNLMDSSTKWETFDHHTATTTPLSSANNHAIPPRFNWEFFD